MSKTSYWLLIISIIFISCAPTLQHEPVNKLEKQFEKHVVRTDYIHKTVIFEKYENDTSSYYISYDSLDRIVNNKNSVFYEYDSLGRINKEYICILSRDPSCSKPRIYSYEYNNDGNLFRILHLNKLGYDSIPYIERTYYYDDKNRLIKHVAFSTDTTVYTYRNDDTNKHTEVRTYYRNDAYGEKVKISEKTIFQYDSIGRKTSQIWSISPSDMSWRNNFFYDSDNRLIMKKDTSLNDYLHEPNTCCNQYWLEYKYDKMGRLIEEIRSTGSYDNPEPSFQRSTKYKYDN